MSAQRHVVWWLAGLFHTACVALLLIGCSPAAERSEPDPPANTPGGSTTTTPRSAGATPFRVVIGETVLTGRLFDNATADDLTSLLPLTLTFRDLNGKEKMSPLPRKLSVNGMPAGDDPQVGDLGYWAPDGNLVLYYGDVGYWTGIMRIGEIDGDMEAVARQSGAVNATIELAP